MKSARRRWGCVALALAATACHHRPDFCTGEPVVAWTPLGVAHSHNDYEHDRPLAAALEQHIASVEADIWWGDGTFPVSHLGITSKGTLAALYLDPLQARVDRDGFVLEKGKPFYLWLDLKRGNTEMTAKLIELLHRYRMFDAKPGGAAVIVALTGNEEIKRAISSRPDGFARDENAISLNDPEGVKGWEYYALPWRDYATDPKSLACLVNHAHRLGRRVRFFGAPDNEATWRLQKAAGVDFVGGDDLPGLAKVMASGE